MTENIKYLFNTTYNLQKNFVTPEIVKYGTIRGPIKYELSKGDNFTRETVYGVTVVKELKYSVVGKKYTDVEIDGKKVNDVFDTKEEALKHIKWLKKVLH